MKNLILAIALVFAAAAQAQAAQKIITFNPEYRPAVKAAVKWLGGTVIREFKYADAVVAEVPAHDRFGEPVKIEGANTIEDDTYQRWIEAAPAYLAEMPLPSLHQFNATLRDLTPAVPAPSADKAVAAAGELPWGVVRVNASGAWNFSTGKGVKVAVIDTGIDYTHPDLAPNYKGGWNAVNNSNDPKDDQGHGTHVSGTIAAARDGRGVAGVAPEADIYAVKVLDKNGSGQYSWIISGIEWAIENKMNVINMSLGGGQGNEALRQVMTKAAEAGVTVVCAAGNDSGPVNYPAKYPEAIAVSASDSSDRIAKFSSRGKEIAVIAPGVAINSTKLGGGYVNLQGTSMASPHVAGLAALAVGAGAKTPAEVRAMLTKAAAQLPGLKPEEQGAGLVNAAKFR